MATKKQSAASQAADIPGCRWLKPKDSVGGTRQSKKPMPTPDEIRFLAYQKWEAAGRPYSDGIDFWLQAERELCRPAPNR
jgi:hypothetical protein